MNRITFVLVVLAVLGSTSLQAADVTTKTKRSDTNKIEISGNMGLAAVFREDFFDSFFPRRDVASPGTWDKDRDEIFGIPRLSLTLQAKLKDELGAVVTLALVPGTYGFEAPLFGAKNSFIYVEEMYAYAKDFLGDYTDLYVGEKNVKIDLRENGDEFFCNILQSENPFTGAVHTDPALTGISTSVSGDYSLDDPPAALAVPPLSSPGGMHWNPYLGGNAWWNNYAGQSKNSTFVGAQVAWALSRDKTGHEPFQVDFAIGMVLESHLARTDTVFFLCRPLITFDITGTFKHLSRIQFILSMISGDKDTAVGALGLGFSIKPVAELELFAEYMGQFGEYTAAQRDPGCDKIHQRAHAAYGGIRVEPEIKLQKQLSITPFVEASFWWIGGDRGDPYQSNEDFISFEDVDTFMIVEDNDFGLDIDCNYNAIKTEIGVRFETFELSIRFGSFRVNFAPHQDLYGKAPWGASYHRLIGNEIDLRVEWRLKESVRVRIGAGFLFDAFFLDDTTRARSMLMGNPAPGHGSGRETAMGIAELMLEF